MIVNLIDTSGFMYRNFYAIPVMTTDSGIHVNALYGFCLEMIKLMCSYPKSMFVAAMDSKENTFRSNIYPLYKATRKKMPDELIQQVPLIKEACDALGFNIIQKPGYEADDIIATCVNKIQKFNKPFSINIFSSDKDLVQLLTNDNVTMYDPLKKKYITTEDVLSKFGVLPNKILDLLSLVGDRSDNIPGVTGIGIKTAKMLIDEFKSLDNLLLNLNKLPNKKKYITLKNEIDNIILSRRLITLKNDVEIELKYNVSIPNKINEFLLKYDLKHILNYIDKNFLSIK